MKKVLISVLLISCSRPDERFYLKKAVKHEKKQEYSLSIKNLNKVLEIGKDKTYLLKASRLATRIKHQNKQSEVKFLKTIVLHTDDEKERMLAQKEVADLHYEIGNFVQAIYEYEKLTSKDLKLAQSYFHLDEYKQALVELAIVEKTIGVSFETKLLKARIKAANLDFDKAIEIYQGIKDQTPTVLIELSQCYEQKGDFTRAIEVLEGSNDKVIQSRLARLRIAKEMQPGASKGLR